LRLGQWLKTFLYASLIATVFFGTAIYHFGPAINIIIQFAIIAVLVSAFIAFGRRLPGEPVLPACSDIIWTIPTILAVTDLILYVAGVRYMHFLFGWVGL